jgi:phospholipid-binding lipoprotein MlaA
VKGLTLGKSILLAVILILGSGCASTKQEASSAQTNQVQGDPRDPLEGFNRTMWDFNYEVLDRFFLKPVTQGYVAITPTPVRSGLRNAVENLEEPANLLNNAAQGKLDGTMVSLARFLINSTVGVLGVFDVADMMELPAKEESFGETLAVWGLETGPYLMLPARGPTDIRSTTGDVVDSQVFPMQALNSNFNLATLLVSVLEGRARALEQEANLQSSLDPYSLVKDAYFQNLEFQVKDGQIESQVDDELLDDFEAFDDLLEDTPPVQ